jgi:hypothetical protein
MFAQFPADGYLTVAHEFEDDMTTSDFCLLTTRLTNIFHQECDGEYHIISNHWQYNPAHSSGAHYQDDAKCEMLANLDGIVDGAAFDIYAKAGDAGRPVIPFNATEDWQRWYELVGKHFPSVGLAERGIESANDVRIDILRKDIKAANELDLKYLCYWQSGGPAGEDKIADQRGQDTFRALAAALYS